MNFFIRHSPIFIIGVLVVIIGLANYKPDTILTGWDNLHPEFNLALNIKRSIFAVWQEYQSLGLLGGMGHAADLVRQLFLLVLSSFLPNHFLRFFWTILTLFLGGIGTVFLTKTLINHSFLGEKAINRIVLPLIAGVFYILNLATLQQYYVPFETFTAHFASLPWMILASLQFFNKQSLKNYLLLFLTLFLTTPQSYVPTLFVVFTLSITILLAVSGVTLIKKRRTNLLFKISLKYYMILFISNAFWLLPFIYFTLTQSTTNVNAKINQMATTQIIAQNKEFGNPLDVMLLKGFWFNAVDPNLQKVNTYMLAPWREHISSPLAITCGLIIFGVILLGLFNVLRKRETLLVSFAVLFVFVFAMLCNNTPPFSWLANLFSHIPLFSQAFRFPFTKFSILAGLLYSLFFAFGIGTILIFLTRFSSQIRLKFVKTLQFTIIGIALLATFYNLLPVFSGHLFYEKEQLKMPNDYAQVFSYFAKVDPTKRIATFPMSNFWSWNFNEWGYGGSGFLWYGLRQPIIDRAFDVWSATSEGSYTEISSALYTKKPEVLLQVLNKYDVSYLLVDRSIYSLASPKSLFYEETEEILQKIPQAKKEATFGKIDIYHIALQNEPQNFVSTRGLLPSSNGYSFSDIDSTYTTIGNYKEENNPSYYVPFRTFYSNKIMDKNYTISESSTDVSITTKLPNSEYYTLNIPSYTTEKVIPIKITVTNDPITKTSLISAQVLVPKVTLGKNIIWGKDPYSYPLFVVPSTNTYSFAINNIRVMDYDPLNPRPITTYLSLEQANYFSLTDTTGKEYVQSIDNNYLTSLIELRKTSLEMKSVPSGTPLTITFPKVIDSHHGYRFSGIGFTSTGNCNTFRNGTSKTEVQKAALQIETVNDTTCVSVFAPALDHGASYLVHPVTANNSGRPLHFWALNDNLGTTPLDLFLSQKDTSPYLTLPPMEGNALGYSFHFDGVSIGQEKSSNTIQRVEIIRFPHTFISNISLTKPYIRTTTPTTFNTNHPNESLYILTPKTISKEKFTVVLSQSYDSGWKAYVVDDQRGIKSTLAHAFPFLFGKVLPSHFKVNNWANGWEINPSQLSQSSRIIIVYLPQYLEIFGFALLGIPIFSALLWISAYVSTRAKDLNPFFERKANDLQQEVNSKLHPAI